MKNIISVFVFGMFGMFGVCSAFAATPTNKSNQAIAASARSVVGLAAVDASGHVLVQNSGVVVAAGLVVGSCHVLTPPSASKFVVEYQHKAYPAALRKLDMPDDACSFVSESLPAPPISIDGKIHVTAGQSIYVVGAADTGLPVISVGKLSSLQKNNGFKAVRKLTATVTTNAVGGGVFDSSGRLIGIDCLDAHLSNKGGVALPLTEIGYLATYGVSPGKSGGAHNQVSRDDLQVVDTMNHGDYVVVIGLLRQLAKKGDARAQYDLFSIYTSGYGVKKNSRTGDYWLIKSAEQGDANSQLQLGAFYVEGAHDIPKDGAKAVHWLSMAAQQSVVMAQVTLGMLYIKGDEVAKNLPKGIGFIRSAANQGSSVAQFALGGAYAAGKGVKRDQVQGAKWLMLAKAHGFKRAVDSLSVLERGMSSAQIAKARQLAKKWSVQHIL